jgi:hypothetical protein
MITRNHPLVHVLAETLLEQVLDSFDKEAVLGRVGCWISNKVQSKITIALLRLRHQLTTQRQGKPHTMLVEEACAVGWEGKSISIFREGQDVLDLLTQPPTQDAAKPLRDRHINEALANIDDLLSALSGFAKNRAEELLSDHRRVREAAEAKGKYSVEALLPPDVIGLFIILPLVE